MAITEIRIYCPDSSMGDNVTEQDAAGYRAWLAGEVRNEFPGADVEVRNEQAANNVRTDAGADDYADMERLQWFVQAAWDRCPWTWVDAAPAVAPLGMTATPLQHYTVDAARETGEWLGEPQATGETVRADEWSARRDTDAEHFDTYEHGDPGAGTQETRAITVRWA